MTSTFTTLNPATEEIIETYPLMNEAKVSKTLIASEKARQHWIRQSLDHKLDCIRNLSKLLQAQEHTLAKLITLEMGKPFKQSQAEIQKCALLCDYYIEHAATYLAPEFIKTSFSQSYRSFEPLGLILGVMPWNFPIWQVFRFAIPNLLLGNGILLKHAPNVTGCGLALEKLMNETLLSESLFSTLIVDVPQIPGIIQDSLVQGITLTGSQRAGQAVAKEAGLALKKVVLELGGNDPYLILRDADLELAANACVQSRLLNTGQVCIAAKRILVDSHIKPDFEALVLEKMQTYQMGDPFEPDTQLGPLARDDLRQILHEQIQRTLHAGARCLYGAKMPTSQGFYYPATFLTDVPVDSPVFSEELFGPVLCLTETHATEHAIELANHSSFGLSAAVFSRNVPQAVEISKQIHAGVCAINTFVASDPRLPFGGVKKSGIGRELSMEGMREFANIKTTVVR